MITKHELKEEMIRVNLKLTDAILKENHKDIIKHRTMINNLIKIYLKYERVN